MEAKEILPLITVYHRKLAETSMTFKRSLYFSINWDVRMPNSHLWTPERSEKSK